MQPGTSSALLSKVLVLLLTNVPGKKEVYMASALYKSPVLNLTFFFNCIFIF